VEQSISCETSAMSPVVVCWHNNFTDVGIGSSVSLDAPRGSSGNLVCDCHALSAGNCIVASRLVVRRTQDSLEYQDLVVLIADLTGSGAQGPHISNGHCSATFVQRQGSQWIRVAINRNGEIEVPPGFFGNCPFQQRHASASPPNAFYGYNRIDGHFAQTGDATTGFTITGSGTFGYPARRNNNRRVDNSWSADSGGGR
jgi:hypothetical protein